jgi:orotate phosphoribosyltransferase
MSVRRPRRAFVTAVIVGLLLAGVAVTSYWRTPGLWVYRRVEPAYAVSVSRGLFYVYADYTDQANDRFELRPAWTDRVLDVSVPRSLVTIRFVSTEDYWLVLVPVWPLIALLAALGWRWRPRLIPPHACPSCGYDLTANASGRCPECGAAAAAAAGPVVDVPSRRADSAAIMTREQLARRIAEVSLLRGEFTLRSGRKSNYYLDKYRFETQPDVLAALGRMIAERVTPDIARLAGPELGAVPLAAAAGMAANKPTVFIRNQKKEYGSSKQIEGVLSAGDRVLLIEDIVTSGGQVVEAARALRDAGAVVERVVVVIDRLEGGRENIEKAGLAFDPLFTTRDLGVTG